MNDPVDIPEIQAVIVAPGAMEVQTRVEIDTAIATAHRFPRSYDAFLKKAETLATCRPEIAQAMEYAKPVSGKLVKGPSSRAAEIIAATYGNLRVQARVISVGEKEIVAQGIAHDLETNVAHSVEVHEPIVKRDGTRYADSQIATMCGSACSKARRNAIFLTVPAALCAPILEAAKLVAMGSAATLPERREKLLAWFDTKGVKRSAIFRWLSIKGENDIDLEKMADLSAAYTSAKEEGISPVDLFGSGSLEKRDSEGNAATKKTTLSDDQQKEVGSIMAAILEEGGQIAFDRADKERRRLAYDPASTIIDALSVILNEIRINQ